MKKLLSTIILITVIKGIALAGKEYIDPPIEFMRVPLRTALDKVFSKVKDPQYSIDTDVNTNVTMRLLARADLESLLNMVLKSKGLMFKKDEKSIYHITSKSDYKEETEMDPNKIILFASFEMQKGFNSRINIDPPIEFSDEPMDSALIKIFEKIPDISFLIDTDLSEVKVNLKIITKTELNELLTLILEPKDLMFEKDVDGVYHIIKKDKKPLEELPEMAILPYETAEAETAESQPSAEMYLEPPIEFKGIPLATALTVIFMEAGNLSYSLHSTVSDTDLVILRIAEKIELKDLLKLLLTPRKLTFNKDKSGMYHIKESNLATIRQGKIDLHKTKKTERIMFYLEPPIEFSDETLKTALIEIFNMVPDISYSVEENLDGKEPVTLRIPSTIEIRDILNLILKPRDLMLEADEKGIFYIRKLK